MRKYINNILGLVLLLITLVSCDQASQEVSPVVSPDGYPVATFTTDFTGSTVSEGDTITYTVTFNKMLDRSVTFRARINSGTLTSDDVELIAGTLAPYTLSTTVSIIFLQDWENDPSETAVIEIGAYGVAEKNLLNLSTVNPIFNLTVGNFDSGILTITMDWHQEVIVKHIVNKFLDAGGYNVLVRDTVEVLKDAGNIDFDVYIATATGFDITDPWTYTYGYYAGATGSIPEVLLMDSEVWPDGEYILWYDLWSNAINTVTAPTTFLSYKDSTQTALFAPNFMRQGTSLDLDIDMDPDQACAIYSEVTRNAVTGAPTSPEVQGVIAKVILADGKFTIEDYEGATSGPWKYNPSRTPRPDFIKKVK